MQKKRTDHLVTNLNQNCILINYHKSDILIFNFSSLNFNLQR